jgi:hypothetical protein
LNSKEPVHILLVGPPGQAKTLFLKCILEAYGSRQMPIAVSGNNLYMAWPNNDTGHWNVFFAKSADGGKTLKTMMISAPNKGNTVDQNTEISASGSNVYVTWWTNKTGTLMPVFRASNDNGDTFAKAITLNSTG